MATYNLGQAAIVSKGAWSSSATYAVLNTVTHNGGSFMAISPNSNKEPGVASGWATYWVATSKGVKTVAIEAVTTTTARAVVTYSDGTTEMGTAFNTSGIPNNSITTAMLQSGVVSAVKLGTDILPTNVGIKMGTAVPTAGTGANQISEGQIYIKYSTT